MPLRRIKAIGARLIQFTVGNLLGPVQGCADLPKEYHFQSTAVPYSKNIFWPDLFARSLQQSVSDYFPERDGEVAILCKIG
jgi:hypothetical protein